MPKVAPVPGYSVMWSVKDFGNITSDLLVVAVKTPGKYTITYETGHAEAEIARTQQQVTYGEAYTLETAKCEGFRFKGWKIKGTQTMFASSGQYRQTGSITLVARWEKDPNSSYWLTDFEADDSLVGKKYTITYDKVYAHAKLEQKELRVATGEAYTLATPECDGYTFKGWKLEGTETVFTDGDEYPYSYGITLVAVWEKKPTSSYWITDFEYDVQ